LARDGEIIFVNQPGIRSFIARRLPPFSLTLKRGAWPIRGSTERNRDTILSRSCPAGLDRSRAGAGTDAAIWASFSLNFGRRRECGSCLKKNAELLANAADVPGEPNVRDWALETLRLVENIDETTHFEPASIPAYTKDGFDRVPKLKLTPDEAQFASQFNGARSVQQIAKNLRLDLKSARQMLFRFVALEIVECCQPARRQNQNSRASSSVLGEWRDATASIPKRVGAVAHERKVLVVDVGGTYVKLLRSSRDEREFPSGPRLKPQQLIAKLKETRADGN